MYAMYTGIAVYFSEAKYKPLESMGIPIDTEVPIYVVAGTAVVLEILCILRGWQCVYLKTCFLLVLVVHSRSASDFSPVNTIIFS